MLSDKLSPAQANEMIAKAIVDKRTDPYTATFARETINFILSDPNCQSIKYSPGIYTSKEDGKEYQTLIAEGLDATGGGLENLIFKADHNCPPECDEGEN